MKRVFVGVLGFLVLLTTSLTGQLVSVPGSVPASTDFFGTIPVWTSALNGLPISAGGEVLIDPIASANGAVMGAPAPMASPDLTAVRIIFFGETTDRVIDFGFTFGAPGVVSPGLQSAHSTARTLGTTGSAALQPLQFWDLGLPAILFPQFDIWANVNGDGGRVRYALHSTWNSDSAGSTNWSTPFMLDTKTFDPNISSVTTIPTATYLLTFEDGTSGDDRSDLVLGVQFYLKSGGPTTAVPEPSTCGWIGVLVMFCLAARQIFRVRSLATRSR